MAASRPTRRSSRTRACRRPTWRRAGAPAGWRSDARHGSTTRWPRSRSWPTDGCAARPDAVRVTAALTGDRSHQATSARACAERAELTVDAAQPPCRHVVRRAARARSTRCRRCAAPGPHGRGLRARPAARHRRPVRLRVGLRHRSRRRVLPRGVPRPLASRHVRPPVRSSTSRRTTTWASRRTRSSARPRSRPSSKFGVGLGAVRTICGTMAMHMELERRLAAFKKTRRSSSSRAASPPTPAPSPRSSQGRRDRLGRAEPREHHRRRRLSRATIKVFPHKDADAARAILKDLPAGQRKLLITDGVFSMDGDLGPLPALCDARRGVRRHHDGGRCARERRVRGATAAARSTTSAARPRGHPGRHAVEGVGVLGGYVAGSARRSSSSCTTARGRSCSRRRTRRRWPPRASPRSTCSREPQLDRAALGQHAVLQGGAHGARLRHGHQREPDHAGDRRRGARAMAVSDRLFEKGVFAQGIGFPTVPRGQARLRTIVTATHTREELQFALDMFGKVGRELGVIRDCCARRRGGQSQPGGAADGAAAGDDAHAGGRGAGHRRSGETVEPPDLGTPPRRGSSRYLWLVRPARTGNLQFVNAGQTPPLLRRQNGAIERLSHRRHRARHVRGLEPTSRSRDGSPSPATRWSMYSRWHYRGRRPGTGR
jgi:glycine C-acetyltransferase